MNFLKKAAIALNKHLSPQNKEKIVNFGKKAHSEAKKISSKIEKKIPEAYKEKVKATTDKVTTKSREVGKKCEEKIYNKYVPKDIRNTISSTIKEIKTSSSDAAEVFKEDMYQEKSTKQTVQSNNTQAPSGKDNKSSEDDKSS